MNRLKTFTPLIAFVSYVLMPVLANAAIVYVGAIQVWPGLFAPAAVIFAGFALSLRDYVDTRMGVRAVLWAILLGTLISAGISPKIAVASGSAFFLSEILDFVVYRPLIKRDQVYWAIVFSNTVGLVIDSVVFLWLAFHSFDYLPGQLIGKSEVTILTIIVVWLYRRWKH